MLGPEEYEMGRPSWVDLATSDLEGAQAFYSALFGWEYEPVPGGGYYYAKVGGHTTAAMARGQNPDMNPMWTTYLAVPSAEDAAERVRAAGGAVIVAPMTVGPAGRMAYFADTTGAAFGVWQGDEHRGAAAINEPGAFTWAELVTGEVDSAAAFYNAAFGLGSEARDFGADAPEYFVFTAGEQVVAGAMAAASTADAAQWLVYFGAADADAVAAAAAEAGGEVVVPPTDTAVGRMAALRDPQGAAFSVIAFAEWAD